MKRLLEAPLGSFRRLHARVQAEMMTHGRESYSDGDFWVFDEHWGAGQLVLYIMNLDLLRPEIVHRLRTIVRRYPGWEIVVIPDPPRKTENWPKMGLYVRPHEIIDALQREFLPLPYRDYHYDGARIGTAGD